MKFSKLISTGSYLPSRILTNDELAKSVDTSHEWIVERTGIYQRHIAAKDETPASMAEQAALKALKKANLSPNDLDLIIVATCTPEGFFPSTACLLQARLNAEVCIAFDVTAACSGFVYALHTADQYIRSGFVKRALVVGTEIMSRVVDWQDRNTCVLFGDGAGAVIIEACDQPGIISAKIYANGKNNDILTLASGLYDQPSHVKMKGREVFKLAVEGMTKAVRALLEENNMELSQVDWIVPHQANVRIIDSIVTKLPFPTDQVIKTVGQHANTSGASIPLALDYGMEANKIKQGQTLLIEAFGGGLTWGSILLKY